MGTIEYLTGLQNQGFKSLRESIFELKNTSIIFVHSWKNQDLFRAGQVSEAAMISLDHIVNEILRKRDELKNDSKYKGSRFENYMNAYCGFEVSPVSISDKKQLMSIGPGLGALPRVGQKIAFVKLLNKIKHRRAREANFRIGNNDEHYFLIIIDAAMGEDDTIVEFEVNDFCEKCNCVSNIV
jgi:hypothetical protein